MSENPKVIIPGNLKGSVPENIVTDALYILDSSRAKNQKVINDEFEQRIDDIQELAEISIEGGTIQIANAADFNNPTQEQRAKVPTVGAVIDGYTPNILPNTGNPTTPIYIDNLHRPQVVTGILLPGNISSQSGDVEALHGGVSAFGIADLSFSEGGGGGTGTVTSIEVNGHYYEAEDGNIVFPMASTSQAGAVQLSDDLTSTENNKAATIKALHDASLVLETDIGELREDIGDIDDKLDDKLDNTPTGDHNLPIYIKEEEVEDEETHETETIRHAVVIDALQVPGDIESTAGGVSAKGIADLSISQSGGGGGTVTAIGVRDTTDTPFSHDNDILQPNDGIIDFSKILTEDLSEYVPNQTYDRGDTFYITGASGRKTAYLVINRMVGALNYGCLDVLTTRRLAHPLNVGTASINALN